MEAEALTGAYRQRAEYKQLREWPYPEEVRRSRENLRKTLLWKCKDRLAERSAGHRTVEVVWPVLKKMVVRKHGSLSFRLVQILIGRGCWEQYYLVRYGELIGSEPKKLHRICAVKLGVPNKVHRIFTPDQFYLWYKTQIWYCVKYCSHRRQITTSRNSSYSWWRDLITPRTSATA